MSTLRTDNIRTLDDTLNIPLTNIALKTDLVASTIAVTPTGGISETNVQAALAGLDTRVTARQPLDATLTGLAGVTTASDTMIYATGVDTFAAAAITPFARTLLDDTTAAAARTTLGTTSLVQGTAQNTTSGTSFDFTGIPAGMKRVTLLLNGVSTNGTSVIGVQIGSGTIQTTGYVYAVASVSAVSSIVGATTAATLQTTAVTIHHGAIVFTRITGNTWAISTNVYAATTSVAVGSGTVTLAGDLDRLRLTTGNGTDLFDLGSVNILYEG